MLEISADVFSRVSSQFTLKFWAKGGQLPGNETGLVGYWPLDELHLGVTATPCWLPATVEDVAGSQHGTVVEAPCVLDGATEAVVSAEYSRVLVRSTKVQSGHDGVLPGAAYRPGIVPAGREAD